MTDTDSFRRMPIAEFSRLLEEAIRERAAEVVEAQAASDKWVADYRTWPWWKRWFWGTIGQPDPWITGGRDLGRLSTLRAISEANGEIELSGSDAEILYRWANNSKLKQKATR